MSDFSAPPPPPPDDRGERWSAEPTPYGGGGPPAGGPAADAYAGFWIRFAGAFIDGVILTIGGAVLGGLVGIQLTGRSGLSFVLGAAYFTYFHGSAAGQTVGNRVVNIRVADELNGSSLDYARAFLRFLMSYVSGVVLLLGYLWMLWDAKRQTWHDKVARSVVVKTQLYPPPGEFGQPAQR